jgi:vacuolar-type H+-ATPase subunit H
MKDIVEKIISTEKKVEQIVKKAHAQVREIKQKAELEASQKVEEARKKANQLVSTAIETTRKNAQLLRDEKLKKAEEEGEAVLSRNQQKIDNLIKDIVQLVIHTEYGGKGT